MALRGKIQAYAENRAAGMAPRDAAIHAGYPQNSVHVTTSRHESRADVKAEIERLKKAESETFSVDNDPTSQWKMKDRYDSPLDLMKDVMNNPEAPKTLRYQAAKDALPYCHARKEGGKKEEIANTAKKTSKAGRYQTVPRPAKHAVN